MLSFMHNIGSHMASKTPSPADIAGLSLWLDASDTSTITQTAGSVSQWDDKSSNGDHVTQSTGSKQPITGVRMINGKNALNFNAAHIMQSTAFTPPLAQPNTIFIVAKYDTLDGYLCDGIELGKRNIIFRSSPDKNKISMYAGITRAAETIGSNTSIFLGVFNEATSEFYLNGGAQSLSPTTIGSNTLTGITLGARYSASDFLDGAIAEVVIYDRILTSTEKNKIGRYLADKWAITWSTIV